jgi:hypothetical protein
MVIHGSLKLISGLSIVEIELHLCLGGGHSVNLNGSVRFLVFMKLGIVVFPFYTIILVFLGLFVQKGR